MAKTVVGLFDDRAAAQNAVRELAAEGFRGDEVSVVSKRPDGEGVEVVYVEEDGREQIEDMAKGAGTGAAIGGAAALLLSLTALSIPGIGPVLAAGPLAALIAGAGIGATAGGLASGLKRLGVEDEEADTYAEGLKRGGTLVTVNTDDQRAGLAVGVMRRLGAVEIDKRAAEWREGGWRGFAETETLRPHVTPEPEEEVPGRVGRRPEATADHTPRGPESEAFQESVVEIREAHEELILNRKGRVVEEIVINKDVDERTETLRETLHETEVEVEPLEPGRARGAASAGRGPGHAPGGTRGEE